MPGRSLTTKWLANFVNTALYPYMEVWYQMCVVPNCYGELCAHSWISRLGWQIRGLEVEIESEKDICQDLIQALVFSCFPAISKSTLTRIRHSVHCHIFDGCPIEHAGRDISGTKKDPLVSKQLDVQCCFKFLRKKILEKVRICLSLPRMDPRLLVLNNFKEKNM